MEFCFNTQSAVAFKQSLKQALKMKEDPLPGGSGEPRDSPGLWGFPSGGVVKGGRSLTAEPAGTIIKDQRQTCQQNTNCFAAQALDRLTLIG